MKVISLTSQKGGIAKTSSTIEIANILKERGYRVLVIDFDQQCSLTKNVGANLKGKTIYHVLHGDCPIKDAIQKNDLFDIIPGSESLSRAEREFIHDDDNFILADLAELIKDDYDFLFIDNAPSRSKLLTMTYIAADYIIIPTVCDESSIDGVVVAQNDIKRLVEGRHHDSHAKVIGYILTNYESTTTMHAIAIENIKDIAKDNPNDPFIMMARKSIKMSEIKTLHTSMYKYQMGSPVARDYYAITDEILKRIGDE